MLEVEKSRVKALVYMVAYESLLLSSWIVMFLLCPHVTEGVSKLSKGLYYKGTNLISESPHHLIPSHCELGYNI